MTLSRNFKYKNRSLEEADELVKKLKGQKNDWQELYLQVAPGKRPAEAVGSDPLSDKRSRRGEGGEQSMQSSSVKAEAGNHRERSRWDLEQELPGQEIVSKRRMSEIVIELWKAQCRKLNRYIPDKPHSGPRHPYPQGFNHGTNISVLLTAASNFKRLTEEMLTWDEKVAFEHRSYLEVIKRNFIPTSIATYKEIKSHPEMALTHRCSPVQDSPGCQERSDVTGATMSGAVSIKRNHPVSPSPPPQTSSPNVTYERNKSSGDHRRDGQDNTKESHPHRIAKPNRDIQFPDPKDLTQEEKTLIQNLNSDIRMIENDEHTEQYIEWRRQ